MKKIKKTVKKVNRIIIPKKRNSNKYVSKQSKKTNSNKNNGLLSINKKLDNILDSQKRLLRGEHEIETEEKTLEEEEKKDGRRLVLIKLWILDSRW